MAFGEGGPGWALWEPRGVGLWRNLAPPICLRGPCCSGALGSGPPNHPWNHGWKFRDLHPQPPLTCAPSLLSFGGLVSQTFLPSLLSVPVVPLSPRCPSACICVPCHFSPWDLPAWAGGQGLLPRVPPKAQTAAATGAPGLSRSCSVSSSIAATGLGQGRAPPSSCAIPPRVRGSPRPASTSEPPTSLPARASPGAAGSGRCPRC